MPRLEHLHLVDQTIFEQPLPLGDVSVEELPPVSLPHLATLQLFGTTYDLTTLVSHITLSSFVDLEIHCTGVETLPQVEYLADFVKVNFSRSSTIGNSSLDVRMNASANERSINVDIISGTGSKRLVSLGIYPKFGEFFKTHVSTICPIILNSIPTAATKRLDMRSEWPISTGAWTLILNRMTEVHVLNASFAGAVDLSHVLGTCIAGTPSFVAKQLRSLTFSGVSFTYKTSQLIRFHEALLECLQKRSNGDQHIEVLNFHSCSDVGPSLPPLFRGVAHKVQWD
jgi:hypothetical protein